ncbi:MAG: hypothetical protein JXB88_20580 [Spirochaetales bacterium]|nr:hypothetical protein [Spirochaetales bacterium]
MRKKNIKFLLCVLVIINLFSCNLLDQNLEVDNNDEITSGSAILRIKADGIMVVNTRDGEGPPIIIAGLPDEIEKVTVNISGENIPTPVIYDLVKIDGIWQGILVNIPAGTATILVEAFDDSDTLLYENELTITIENNKTISLNLTLLPVDPPAGYNVKAPRIDLVNISPQQVAPGDPVNLQVFAHDPEPGGPLTYVWTPASPGIFSDRNAAVTTWTAPAEEGFYNLTITIIDMEFLLDHFTIIIEVDDAYGNGNVAIELGTNDFPVIYSMIADPTRINKGESTQLSVEASDPDGDEITFLWTSDLDGVFDDSTIATPVFTIDPGVEYGPCVLTVEVSDGTLATVGMIQINITPEPEINLAPVVTSAFQSAGRVSPGGEIKYIIRAKDPEGTALSFTWSTPDGGTFGTQVDTINGLDYQSEIIWTAPDTGTTPGTLYTVTVSITDAEGLANIFSFQSVEMQ